MRLKPLVLSAILFILISGCATNGVRYQSAWGKKVNWRLLEAGRVEAKESGKPLLIDFYVSEDCHRCMQMEKYVYGDETIAEQINKDFIPVKIDLSKPLMSEELALGKQYDFKFECLLIFESPEGELLQDDEIGRFCFTEMVTAEWFARYLKRAKELCLAAAAG